LRPDELALLRIGVKISLDLAGVEISLDLAGIEISIDLAGIEISLDLAASPCTSLALLRLGVDEGDVPSTLAWA
jgi:hypothetical protein